MTPAPEILPLDPEGPLGSEHWERDEEWAPIFWSDHQIIRNVRNPTLTVCLPDPETATGTGIILCPGGGWHFLAYQEEGLDVARQLNGQGIAAFILKYRLIQTGDDYRKEVQQNMADADKRTELMAELAPLILDDGQTAVRMVRERADEWHLDTKRIGVIGYSAGGNVALNVALKHEPGSRPDFVVGIYTAGCDDVPLTDTAPPLLLLCAADDAMAATNSLSLYDRWRKAGIPVEMHIYSKGGHGFCLRQMGLPVDRWLERVTDWLHAHDFVSQARTM